MKKPRQVALSLHEVIAYELSEAEAAGFEHPLRLVIMDKDDFALVLRFDAGHGGAVKGILGKMFLAVDKLTADAVAASEVGDRQSSQSVEGQTLALLGAEQLGGTGFSRGGSVRGGGQVRVRGYNAHARNS